MSMGSQSGSARDITLEQIRAVLEFSPVPTSILQWNKIAYINPAALALLGPEEAEEVIYHSILKWTDPEEPEEIRRERMASWVAQSERIAVARKNWVCRNRKWIRQDGSPLVVEVKAWAIPLFGGDGTQITFTDITAQNQTEQVRLKDEDWLRLAIESGNVRTWDLNPATGRVQW